MTLVGEDAEPDCHLLDDVENRNEHEFGQNHPVTPLGSGLGGRYQASRVGVREHHQEARTPHGQEPRHKPATTGPLLSVSQRRGRFFQGLQSPAGSSDTARANVSGWACGTAWRD